jgi:hypothetical protein
MVKGQVWWFTAIITLIRRWRFGGSQFKFRPRQKVPKIPSQSISWAWWFMPMIPATREAVGRIVGLSVGKNRRPYLKNN